jgi:putative toxin-antitoxin system antitoxin component (TIGR02293 family)
MAQIKPEIASGRAAPVRIRATSPARTAGRTSISAESVKRATRRGDAAPDERTLLVYLATQGVDDFVDKVSSATPMQLVDAEREGVAGQFFKDISKRMDIPAARMFIMLGVPKATAEKKVAAGEAIKGSGGRAALGLARLLGIVNEIVENSTAEEAKNFDAARWLGQWLERPQPALGGRKPADLLDTAAGLEVVARLLGSIQSGTYQ